MRRDVYSANSWVLTGIMIAFASTAFGCGEHVGYPYMDVEDEIPEEDRVELAYHSSQLGDLDGANNRAAVGATIDVEVRNLDQVDGVESIAEATVDDPKIFEITEIAGDEIRLKALEAGTATVEVTPEHSPDHFTNRSFSITSEPIEHLSIERSCGLLDEMAGLVETAACVTDETYSMNLNVPNVDGRRITGDELSISELIDVEPAGAIEWAETSIDFGGNATTEVGFTVESVAQSVRVESLVDDTSVEFPVRSRDDVEIGMFRTKDHILEYDELEHAETETHFGDDEISIDIKENELYLFLPFGFAGERAVCDADAGIVGAGYHLESWTPDVCKVTDYSVFSRELADQTYPPAEQAASGRGGVCAARSGGGAAWCAWCGVRGNISPGATRTPGPRWGCALAPQGRRGSGLGCARRSLKEAGAPRLASHQGIVPPSHS